MGPRQADLPPAAQNLAKTRANRHLPKAKIVTNEAVFAPALGDGYAPRSGANEIEPQRSGATTTKFLTV